MIPPAKYSGAMTAKQFDKAAKQTNLTPATLSRARRVLVDGMTAREVAEIDGVDSATVFNAIANVCSRHDEKI